MSSTTLIQNLAFCIHLFSFPSKQRETWDAPSQSCVANGLYGILLSIQSEHLYNDGGCDQLIWVSCVLTDLVFLLVIAVAVVVAVVVVVVVVVVVHGS